MKAMLARILVRPLLIPILGLLGLLACAGKGEEGIRQPRERWDGLRQRVDIRIVALLEEERYPEVIALTDSLAEAGIRDVRLSGQRAQALGYAGREEEAVALFEEALREDYPHCENHLNFAVLLMKMGKTGRALTEFSEAKRFCGSENLARIFRNLAVANLKLGQEAEAYKNVQEGLEIDGDDPYLLGLKGMLVAEEKPVLAESLFARAGAQEELDTEFLYELGLVFLRSHRLGKAVAPLERVLRRRPGDREISLNLAEALAGSGKSEEAERILTGLLRDKTDPEVERKLARIWFRQERFEEALEIYRRLPDDPVNRDRVAMCLHGLGRFQEALTIQREVVAERPDWTVGMINLAVILGALGELEEAERILERVLEMDAENLAATLNLEMIRQARIEAQNAPRR
ncbi:MAG: tetratricopeptide repeat protein [Candidatus Krumholzibacteriota bacterium]|nr:tetratricopeptide repeat protein [Candidatus Krumholzibacteriota bacterium]